MAAALERVATLQPLAAGVSTGAGGAAGIDELDAGPGDAGRADASVGSTTPSFDFATRTIDKAGLARVLRALLTPMQI